METLGENLSETEEQKNEDSKEDSDVVHVPVERYVPETLVAHYSDAATILHSENEFILSFFQTEHPVAGTKAELAKVKSARSKCVARIIMSPKQMMVLVNVLQENLDKYKATYTALEPK